MALNKLTSLDKSRSSSITDTEDTIKQQTKTTSISSSSLDDKDEQQPKAIIIRNKKCISDNRSVSSMSLHGGSTTTISPYGGRIPRKNKKETFINFDHRE